MKARAQYEYILRADWRYRQPHGAPTVDHHHDELTRCGYVLDSMIRMMRVSVHVVEPTNVLQEIIRVRGRGRGRMCAALHIHIAQH